MKRRTFIFVGVGAALCHANALPATGAYRIGFLGVGATPGDGLPPVPLRKAIEMLGYEGAHAVTFVGRWANADHARLPDLANELVQAKVELIVTQGTSAAVAASEATRTIPIVMTLSGDPVGVGLIPSLAHPGGNVTGITDDATTLSAKRLQILKEAIPSVATVALLWNADDRAMTLRYKEIDKAARLLNISVAGLGVRAPDDFELAFDEMNRKRPDALFMVTDAFTNINRKRVLDFAQAQRIPAMYEYDYLVREGGLMSYGPSFDDMFERAAIYIDKILKGTRPRDLPIEQPTKFYLVVNLNTARTLGLAIPRSILSRADRVIE